MTSEGQATHEVADSVPPTPPTSPTIYTQQMGSPIACYGIQQATQYDNIYDWKKRGLQILEIPGEPPRIMIDEDITKRVLPAIQYSSVHDIFQLFTLSWEGFRVTSSSAYIDVMRDIFEQRHSLHDLISRQIKQGYYGASLIRDQLRAIQLLGQICRWRDKDHPELLLVVAVLEEDGKPCVVCQQLDTKQFYSVDNLYSIDTQFDRPVWESGNSLEYYLDLDIAISEKFTEDSFEPFELGSGSYKEIDTIGFD